MFYKISTVETTYLQNLRVSQSYPFTTNLPFDAITYHSHYSLLRIINLIKELGTNKFVMPDCFPDPYVRVIQLNGSTGRSIKRKKTAFKHGTECPEFNETLTFDLSPNQLETTTFLVLLCSRTLDEGSDGQTDKKSKDKCLGKVALGSHVVGKQQRDHWLSVIQNPRRVMSAWYTLR